jgi:Antibiotic biosynthesis monooxygenase
MFARIVEFEVKLEKKEEFIKVVKNEILPILHKTTGFLEILPFVPENTTEKTIPNKVVNITLWSTKPEADKYDREVYPRVYQILKPFLTGPVTVRPYTLETTLCERFMETFAA